MYIIVIFIVMSIKFFNLLMRNISKWSDTLADTPAADPARFLKSVRPFWDVMHRRVKLGYCNHDQFK